MTLREQAGQQLIVGLEGTSLSAAERAWLRLIRPAGVILFRRNIEEPAQVASLLREATECAGAPLFRCVDLEGGLVDRLRDCIAPMPSAAAVFRSGRAAAWKMHGHLVARELRALGFNTTFAPVLDLALPASTPVMRSRVTSPDPDKVVAYASAFLDGLAQDAILGCGKHFPGLGAGALDSHEAMPAIDRTWEEMWSADLAPYRALLPRLSIVMVAHAAYPRVTGDRLPASISPYWITTILRKQLNFRGLILSDDMEMGGVLKEASMEDAAVAAIAAGTDLIEICSNPALIFTAYEAVLHEAESSAAFRRRVTASSARVTAHKQRLLDARMPRPASAGQIAKLAAAVRGFASKIDNAAPRRQA